MIDKKRLQGSNDTLNRRRAGRVRRSALRSKHRSGSKVVIAFTGGGTGGHVFPGLAVIEELNEHDHWHCVWIGSLTGIERAIVRRQGIDYYGSPCGKLRRYFSLRNAVDILWCAAGVLRSLILIARLRPVLLFSKGGYVSVPPVVAAHLLGIPVITHESDLTPGLATRINARCATAILVSYQHTTALFAARLRSRVSVTGNPVRRSISAGDRNMGLRLLGLDGSRPVLLFLGGSLGAAQINELVATLLPHLIAGYDVIHQHGSNNRRPAPLSDRDTKLGRYVYRDFFGDDFPHILAASTLVICRAGASTLWELAAQHKPALLLPLQAAGTRGDQVANALLFCSLGSATMLDSEEILPSELLLAIEALMARDRRSAMSAASQKLPAQAAAGHVADHIRVHVHARLGTSA